MGLEVNKRITECRLKAKLTKKQVAERLGMKYTTYCRMEKEAKRIDVQEGERIAKVLGVSSEYILYGNKNYDFTPLEQKILTVESPNRGKSPFDPPTPPVVKYTPDEFICSSEEKALITIFRTLSLDEKKEVRDFLDQLKR
ncbi:MAG: helix-turn-helix domain-containing protein [Clostridia bacterium]|nr:helix-turn-helix domain-containing protein [Clostridia bacterium]